MPRKIITADVTSNELPATAKFATGSELESQVDAKIATKQDAGSYVLTSDSRLTDSRTPKSHTHPISEVSGLQTIIDDLTARIEALETPA